MHRSKGVEQNFQGKAAFECLIQLYDQRKLEGNQSTILIIRKRYRQYKLVHSLKHRRIYSGVIKSVIID